MTPDILEMMMLICFGVAWPTSILKSWRAKTAKGKSIIFLAVVFLGYICGISAKIVGNEVTYVLFFYVLNFVMVALDIALYFVNRHRDNLAQQACPHET